MSQILTLDLSDEVYTAIRRQAEVAGTSPAHWVANALEQQYSHLCSWQKPGSQQAESEKQAARERFEHHFGEVNLGYATGVDNERIDADLAREYADLHEAD